METKEAIKAVIEQDGLGSAVEWIANVVDEKHGRIEKLEAALNCNLPDYDPKIGVVERLRQLGNWRVDGTKSSPIYNKSADRIEKLEAALREVLSWVNQYSVDATYDDHWPVIEELARKALEGKDE